MAFSYIILGGISSSLITGYYFLNKEKQLYRLFESLEKIPEFDFDYLGRIEDLPINQPFALCAEIDLENTSSRPSLYNPKKRIVLSSVKRILPVDKKVTKQTLNDENEHFDEFYNTINNHQLPDIYLINGKEERIKIEWPNTKEIGLFNIKPIVEKIDPKTLKNIPSESINERFLSFLPSRKKAEYGEIGLVADEKYVYIGELTKNLSNIGEGKLDVNLVFKSQFVLGESKNYFLKYLDGQLVKMNKRGRRAFMVGIGLMGIHLGYTMYNKFRVENVAEGE